MTMNALWWWIDRWRKSTAYTDMTLEQQGAYRNLLDEATLRGGVIPNDERVLAKACGDAKAWRRVRAVVLARFDLHTEGLRNQTLDAVLTRSEEIRISRAASGRRGGLAKASKPPSKQASKPLAKPVANGVANTLAPDPDPSPSLNSKRQERQPSPPIITSPLAYERRKTQCAYVGSRLEVPHGLHADLRKLLGGANADTDLLAWYADVDEEIERTNEPIAPDIFKWLKARYARWAVQFGDNADEADMVRMLEADVAERKGRPS